MFYGDGYWGDVVIEQVQPPLVLLGAGQAKSYPAEYARVRHQLNEAKKAQVFFMSSGGRVKGKGFGKGPEQGQGQVQAQGQGARLAIKLVDFAGGGWRLPGSGDP